MVSPAAATTTTWFQLVQTFGIITSFLISAYAAFKSAKAMKLNNYMKLTEYHRDIWRMTMERESGLDRVRSLDPALGSAQLTAKEAQFLTFLFLHIVIMFELQRNNQLIGIQQAGRDIRDTLKAPLIRRFWEENKRYYNDDFVGFVDGFAPKMTGSELDNARTSDQ